MPSAEYPIRPSILRGKLEVLKHCHAVIAATTKGNEAKLTEAVKSIPQKYLQEVLTNEATLDTLFESEKTENIFLLEHVPIECCEAILGKLKEQAGIVDTTNRTPKRRKINAHESPTEELDEFGRNPSLRRLAPAKHRTR